MGKLHDTGYGSNACTTRCNVKFHYVAKATRASNYDANDGDRSDETSDVEPFHELSGCHGGLLALPCDKTCTRPTGLQHFREKFRRFLKIVALMQR
jgi:hypothetical protein